VDAFIFDCDGEAQLFARAAPACAGARSSCVLPFFAALLAHPFCAPHCTHTRYTTTTTTTQGVIWRGDSVIDGVPETLDMLRAAGKRLVFVTNNSTKSRKGYLGKFTSLGLNINAVRFGAGRGGVERAGSGGSDCCLGSKKRA
jgi:hypothetical protein